ncbi:MAG: T9SS type A sorting domain-containing protein [Flavobacteriales bacterium]
MKKIKKLFFALVFVFSCINTNASHLVAGEISYIHIANNTYQVTLTLFRDCMGVAMVTPQLNFSSMSCSSGFSISTTFVSMGEVQNYCTAPSTCSGGSVWGYEYYIYSTTVNLNPCPDWVISYFECCRNHTPINVQNPGSHDFCVTATLNNSTQNNNSPIFSHMPALLVNSSSSMCLNNTAFDTDGDSLVYSLVDLLSFPTIVIPFAPGYSSANPLGATPGVVFNPHTGNLCKPNSTLPLGGYLLAVKVEEYRNGTLIGSVTRDMQIISGNFSSFSTVDVEGTVTDALGALQPGVLVELFEYNISEGSMPLISSTTTNLFGQYVFSGVDLAQYMVRAQPSNPIYLPTYHESTFYWNLGQISYSICDSIYNGDIELVTALNPIGTGLIAGYLNGFGLRSGDPMEDIYIYLIDRLSGNLVAHSKTDASGYYEITNVPDGEYKMIVDIVGLLMLSYHYPVISSGNSVLSQDFMATEDGIYAATFTNTSLNSLTTENKIILYPNPGKDFVTIEQEGANQLLIVIYDMSGRKVAENLFKNNPSTIPVSQLDAGTYFIVVSSNEAIQTLKWIKE